MIKMKYCLGCGQIYSDEYDGYDEQTTCIGEGYPLIEDPDMTEDKFSKLSEKDKDAYELHILKLCKQSEFFSPSRCDREKNPENYYLTFRFDKYEQITGKKAWTKANALYHDTKARESINQAFATYAGSKSENKPKCPTCQSTNIQKISGIERGTSVALFGLFSKKINKSFKCGNCGYTW